MHGITQKNVLPLGQEYKHVFLVLPSFHHLFSATHFPLLTVVMAGTSSHITLGWLPSLTLLVSSSFLRCTFQFTCLKQSCLFSWVRVTSFSVSYHHHGYEEHTWAGHSLQFLALSSLLVFQSKSCNSKMSGKFSPHAPRLLHCSRSNLHHLSFGFLHSHPVQCASSAPHMLSRMRCPQQNQRTSAEPVLYQKKAFSPHSPAPAR